MTIKTTTPSSNGIKVLLIYTGGTIGMLENPVTKGLEVCDFAYVAEHVQEISQLPFGIDTLTFEPPCDRIMGRDCRDGDEVLRCLRWFCGASRHRYYGLYRFWAQLYV